MPINPSTLALSTLNPNAAEFVPQTGPYSATSQQSLLAADYQAFRTYATDYTQRNNIDWPPSTASVDPGADDCSHLLDNLSLSLNKTLEPIIALGSWSRMYQQSNDLLAWNQSMVSDINHILSQMPADERETLCEIMGADPMHLEHFVLRQSTVEHPAVRILKSLIQSKQTDQTHACGLEPPHQTEPTPECAPVATSTEDPTTETSTKKSKPNKSDTAQPKQVVAPKDKDLEILEQAVSANRLTFHEQSAVETAKLIDSGLDALFTTPFKGGNQAARQQWVNKALSSMHPTELLNFVMSYGFNHRSTLTHDGRSLCKQRSQIDNNLMQLAIKTIDSWPRRYDPHQPMNQTVFTIMRLVADRDFSELPIVQNARDEEQALRIILSATRGEFCIAGSMMEGRHGVERSSISQRGLFADVFLFSNGMQNYVNLSCRLNDVPVIGKELMELFAHHLSARGIMLLGNGLLTLNTLDQMNNPVELGGPSLERLQNAIANHTVAIEAQKDLIKQQLIGIALTVENQQYGHLQPNHTEVAARKMETSSGRQIAYSICKKASELIDA